MFIEMTFIASVVMLIVILYHINKLPYCGHHIINIIKTLIVLPFNPKRIITKVIFVNI